MPGTSIPAEAPQTTVPARDFGVAGTLAAGTGHDESAVYAVLYGTGDGPVDWLRAGEALSAAWLDAVDHGLTLLPFSAPAEIASTRLLLQRLVSYVGHPYLVFRLGVAPRRRAGGHAAAAGRADRRGPPVSIHRGRSCGGGAPVAHDRGRHGDDEQPADPGQRLPDGGRRWARPGTVRAARRR